MASNSRQFRFDATAHAYYVGRRRLPSITQILNATANPSPAGGLPPPHYTEASRVRGVRIHAATARFDLGGGWGEDLLVEDIPRIRAYDAFLRALRPSYDEVEQPRWSKVYGYAGTPDRFGRWPDGRTFVLDLKTGPESSDHGLQTVAQAMLREKTPEARLRYTLHLRDDETYRLIRWDDPSDWPRFLQRFSTFTEGGPSWLEPTSL